MCSFPPQAGLVLDEPLVTKRVEGPDHHPSRPRAGLGRNPTCGKAAAAARLGRASRSRSREKTTNLPQHPVR